MMARLLEAVRPRARLVLVGDPRQLTSVGAGAVLSRPGRGLRRATGLAGRGADRELPLRRRTSRRSPTALRDGDADAVLARAARRRPTQVEFVETDDAELERRCAPDSVAAGAARVRAAAERRGRRRGALAALDRHRLLCAHREGPYGVRRWNRQVERWLGRGDRRAEIYGAVVRRPPAAGDQPTTTRSTSTTARPAWWCAQGRRPARVRRRVGAAQATSRPAGSTRSRPCTR